MENSTQPDSLEYQTIPVLGMPVGCVTYDSALDVAKRLARQNRPRAICPANTHIIGEARHDPEFGAIMTRFDLILPDGMPIVWALNSRGAGLADRVYGPYFMKHALERTPGWRHFFFGDSEECLADLQRVVKALQPDLQIVGAISPPFRQWSETDEIAFADAVNAAEPDFVWVALPGVRMERWIMQNQFRYRKGVFVAVGDAFSLLSGRRKFAPRMMQRIGLTWLYRLASEPLRLGPRYLRYNLLFLFYCFWDRFFARSHKI